MVDSRQTRITSQGSAASLTVRPGDIIAVLIGLRWPVILRPSNPPGPFNSHTPSTNTYQLIGRAYIPNLEHGDALRGRLPPNIKVHYGEDHNNRLMQVFTHLETGEVLPEDPRLGGLPEDWYRMDVEPGEETGLYKNRVTGEISREPRESVVELRKKGVDVRKIVLV